MDRGYALLVLMMMATILLVSLTVALPSIYLEGQREREEELIFRGNDYARAIALFHRQFNRFPRTVDELLRTNGIRFLRHAYKDPMSRSGKWRFIHAAANGALLDSRTMGPARQGQQSQGLGEKPAGAPAGSQQKGSSSSGEEAPRETSSFFGSGVQGALIVGVASSSSRESVRVWNNFTHYDDWEFLGIGGNVGMVQPGQASQPAPGQQGIPGRQGMQPPMLPPLTDQPMTPR